MDTNTLLNIAKFADPPTTYQMIKSYGRPMYDDMLAMGVVREIDIENSTAASLVFTVPHDIDFEQFYEITLFIENIFQIDKFFEIQDFGFREACRKPPPNYCFCTFLPRSYKEVANNDRKNILLVSTKPSFIDAFKQLFDKTIYWDILLHNPVFHFPSDHPKNDKIVLKVSKNKFIPVYTIKSDNSMIYCEVDLLKLFNNLFTINKW